ncbi:phosphopentomutase [Falsirhodobacter deserti]|uniref:phosphopentomutase n=1 Tax=Falsirhodobacter deserti TaxID=1365611 RepID=UPI000FE42D54|nr:phosphopentomutase [Falsirhodobacter deserti]
MSRGRVFLTVLDRAGCGGAPDAAAFGDEGANTLAHIAQRRPLHMPVLDGLGLGAAIRLASGDDAPGLGAKPTGLWGAATEVSRGKDTPSGHWELSGVPVPWDWGYFRPFTPFDEDVVAEVSRLAGTDGILDGGHSGGIAIIGKLGEEHLRTGRPICYTSVDSVFQIAAHEEVFGLGRLLDLCEALAPMLHARRVGRVIARPFTGMPGAFRRTGNRRDYAIAPPGATILDRAQATGHVTHAVGKIGDIFSHRGIDHLHEGTDAELAEHLVRLGDEAEDGALVFSNFVEFDSLYGHPRDVDGYARHLEWFDTVAGRLIDRLRPDDIAIFTADHGNDPTWRGSDHTRERVPVLVAGRQGQLGLIPFTGVADLVAGHLGLA